MEYKGKIRSVTVNNFITYDMVKFFAGPYLNIVLGPNGTGKSTLVAAIVIGMGGSCHTLSRGKKLEDYIKNGQTKAAVAVEIYLNDSQDPIEFYRSFDIYNCQSFKIDKKKVTQKVFLERVRSFNIQIDNLCQFLPQDRVQDFAKMNPEEVFTNTVKSVCDGKMQGMFEELRAMEKSNSSSASDVSKWRMELKDAEVQNGQLKVRIENMAARTKLQELLQVARIKKSHLHLEELTEKTNNYKKDLDFGINSLREHEKRLAPIKEESKEYREQIKRIEGEMTAQKSAMEKISGELFGLEAETEKMEEAIRTAKLTLANAKKQKQSQEMDIAEESNILTALIQDLKECLGHKMELDSRKESVNRELSECQRNSEHWMRERSALMNSLEGEMKTEMTNAKRRIEIFENAEHQQLQTMQNRFPDMYKATVWLRENRGMFRGRVYDPIVLELKLKNLADGKFLENMIAIRDLTAFVCEETEDMKMLVRKLTKEMRLVVNVVQSDAASTIRFKSKTPIEELGRFGFRNYLLDLVEGPIPVLNYLCKISNLHNIPVGTDRTTAIIDDLVASNKFSLFFTPNQRYSVAKSKYSSASSTTCNEITGKNLLSVAMDVRKMEEAKMKLQDLQSKCDSMSNKVSQYESKMSHNETKMRQLSADLKGIEKKLHHMISLQERVKMQKRKVEELKALFIDLDEEAIKCKTSVKELLKQMMALEMTMIEKVESYAAENRELMFNREFLKRFNTGNSELKKKLCEAEQAVEGAQKLVDQIKGSIETHKRRIAAKKEEIQALIAEVFPANMKYKEREDFKTLPATEEELQDKIDELQAQVDCMEGRNEGIIEEFEAREKKIGELQGKIANNSAEQKKLHVKMEEIHRQWYPKIEEIVNKINEKFSKFMSSMNYAGSIELKMKDEFQYSSYGIAIRVVYRNNEALQQLNSFLQSGGERTVAIATYTLALQQLSQVPFRCVDEINQGMDPKNERKIFEMLVEETAKPGMSQYFFITPKILPNLKSNEFMTFHCVFNGPHLENAIVFLSNI